MSDSIDRVFVKAISTIRALSSRSTYGSLPRPPAENRIKLYGLYKQATEGNVEGVMARPVGYTLEDEGAKRKWDAWKTEEGLSKTEAKRLYISYLIETIRSYAIDSIEAKELLSELEYLWDQIKGLQYSPNDEYSAPTRLIYPSISPSVSHSDKFSTATPFPIPSNVSVSMTSQQYRNNLSKIYSHSRRSTMVSLQDNLNSAKNIVLSRASPEGVAVSEAAYNQSRHTPTDRVGNDVANINDLKTWQGEINLIINKLSREYLNKRSRPVAKNFLSKQDSESDCESDIELDIYKMQRKVLKRLILSIAKFGVNLIKSLSLNIITLLIIFWYLKRNLKIKSKLLEECSGPRTKNRELLLRIASNQNENSRLLRILGYIFS